MKNYNKNIVSKNISIREAFERMNELGSKLTLFIVDESNALVGTLTDGDIRRSFLKGLSVAESVEKCMFLNFRYISKSNLTPTLLKEFRDKKIRLVPILDEHKRILNIIDLEETKAMLPINAVIMAGGKGERLWPLTKNKPKPLLTVGDKPIIEHNIDWLIAHGVSNITITVKYLAEQIEDYFKDGKEKNISISYVKENEPLGTIGALKLANDTTEDTVLVMNSDLLTNINFEDFYLEFIEKNADMAVATIPYKVNIPYAIVETENDTIISLKEKPTYTYYSNAGIYLIKKPLIDFIPSNQKYDATDFIELLLSKGKKVIYFPILNYWLDIGKPEDYEKANEDIKHIDFN
ncbi:MAG: nucleotidyltransferase family protein [Bacteroidetes bacterium]|nr:nucleotidyltransferase family protein [Bacteroidota bacterium]